MEQQKEQQNYVELRHVDKWFGDYQASKDITFGIPKGKLVGLLGPSGSGKTTILRMLAGLEAADDGEIVIDGKVVNDVPASERGIGFVFQNYALFRYMTVYDNIAFGLKIQKRPKEEIRARVEEMIRLVGLEGLEKRHPKQLSGGQQQRVAFARALAPEPRLLLLDEPFAAVDAKVRKELRRWLRDMISRVGVTSIFVTHDQDEAIEVADEIIVTNQGRIEQIGSPVEIYRSPKTPFVAQFIGQSTQIREFRKLKGFEYATGDVEHAVVRPEYVKIYREGEPVQYPNSVEEGTVEQVAFRGREMELTVSLRGEKIIGRRLLDQAPVEEGEKVLVFIYRLFAFNDREARVINNICLKEPVVVI